MGFGGALLAMSAVQGITSISAGYAKGAEDKYNSSIAGLQAQAIGVQGEITQGQYTRKGGQLMSSQTAVVAGAGLEMTGSAAAVMIDSQAQIHTDMAIAKYNTEMGQNYENNKASAFKRQAAMDVSSGYSGAFSEMLSGAEKYAMFGGKKSFNMNGGVYAGPGQTSTVL